MTRKQKSRKDWNPPKRAFPLFQIRRYDASEEIPKQITLDGRVYILSSARRENDEMSVKFSLITGTNHATR